MCRRKNDVFICLLLFDSRSFNMNFVKNNNIRLFHTNKNQNSLIEKKYNPQKIVRIKQVHGNEIVNVNSNLISSKPYEADALISNQKNILLLIKTADCMPIFIYDKAGSGIGLVHAGWRGLKKGIAEKTVLLMSKQYGINVADLFVYIGPSIRPCCYEVSEDFLGFFKGRYCNKREGKYFFDLCGYQKNALINLGVPKKNIMDSDICTCCSTEYHSYRRDGDSAGRILSGIMLI